VLQKLGLEALRQNVRACLDALEQGDCDEYDAGDIRSLAADIMARGRKRLASLARNSDG
jgi:hypothetical protein